MLNHHIKSFINNHEDNWSEYFIYTEVKNATGNKNSSTCSYQETKLITPIIL